MCLPSFDRLPSVTISPIAYASSGDHSNFTLPSGFIYSLDHLKVIATTNLLNKKIRRSGFFYAVYGVAKLYAAMPIFSRVFFFERSRTKYSFARRTFFGAVNTSTFEINGVLNG